jgi:hypothetical protein
MANKRSPQENGRPKAVLRLPDPDQAKSAVLNRATLNADRRAQDLSDDGMRSL